MDAMGWLLQDWLCIVLTILIGLGTVIIWIWFGTKKAKPAEAVMGLVFMILITSMAVGAVSLLWGGRAYFMAHRTEADNPYAEAKEQEVIQAQDIDMDLVEKIRKEREEKERQRRLEEERRASKEARDKSEEYFKSLHKEEEQ